MKAWSGARTVAEIDWRSWAAVDRATLLFIIHGERILLIRKKRGLGAGKINGPGGRLEADESPLEAARREVHEELRITPSGVRRAGELHFQFLDGYSIHVDVFRATAWEGEPTETEEAAPLWFGLDEIPYEQMWEDDRLWIPLMLEERPFSGRFVFDGDRMLDQELEAD